MKNFSAWLPYPRRESYEPAYPRWVSYEPTLVPSPKRMGDEGISNLEEWFRWAEEWSMLLRIYGGMKSTSSLFEIGCGQGRVAFALRYYLEAGRYRGFDISQSKIEHLRSRFQKSHPNFEFVYADIHNTHYNPTGRTPASQFRFPGEDKEFDIVYAASIFTHMIPENTAHYFSEARRVLSQDGRCIFSFFILDYFVPGKERPLGFAKSDFEFVHEYAHYKHEFAIADPNDSEKMTSYSLALIASMAKEAGLVILGEPVKGLWSGTAENPIAAQDIVILQAAS